MPLVLTFNSKVSSDGKKITITDTTGSYSPLLTTGWNSPNTAIANVLAATIKISKRDSDGIFGVETIVNVFPALPSAIGGSMNITSIVAGQGGGFSDGIYKIIYTITGNDGNPFSYSTIAYRVVTSHIKSCWQQLAKDVSICTCGCEHLRDKFRCTSEFWMLLCAAEDCGDLNGIQKYIDILTAFCDSDCCGCFD